MFFVGVLSEKKKKENKQMENKTKQNKRKKETESHIKKERKDKEGSIDKISFSLKQHIIPHWVGKQVKGKMLYIYMHFPSFS